MADKSNNLNNSPRAVRQRLESLLSAGLLNLPRGHFDASVGANASPPVAPEPARKPTPGLTPPKENVPTVDQSHKIDPAPTAVPSTPPSVPSIAPATAATLEVLQQQVTACTACEELASTRTQTVFGVGNPNARLCFMGEAPGADEDRLGEPFVGRAGQLLTKIIEACHLTRDEVYILNVLKCRPPGNRNPHPAESAACRGFLLRQLELIQPEFICCLGAVAAQNFLQTDQPIGRLRGKIHQKDGFQVACTYHPAYLLRNPSAKRSTWDDMKLLMRQMGMEL